MANHGELFDLSIPQDNIGINEQLGCAMK